MSENNILQDLSFERVALALDANNTAYHTLFTTLPQVKFHNAEGLVWFETGIDSGTFNGVLQTRKQPEELPATIERILAHFQRRNLPFHWHIGSSSHPADFGSLLESHGIGHDEDLPGMAVDLLTLNEDIPVVTNLVIHPVTTDELLHQWTDTWGCRAPTEEIQRWFTVYSGIPFGPERSLRLYLGTIDEKPIATTALLLAAGVASINWVVTIPQVRRQGIGAAMTLMAAREARSAGYRIGVLVASPMGINIYRRLGFKECCIVSTYEWNPTDS